MSSTASFSPDPTMEAFIATLDVSVIRELALETRLKASHEGNTSADEAASMLRVSCDVLLPPKYGTYNVAYEVAFSDNVSWVVRIRAPFEDAEWTPVDARCIHHDVTAMGYIASRTSVPVPRIHAYACDIDNPLRHPYIIMDKIHGTRLLDVWYEPAWGNSRRENALKSLGGYMAELATLEFDKIGRLDRAGPEGPYSVAPFPSVNSTLLDFPIDGAHPWPVGEFGPFHATREFLTALMTAQRGRRDSPMYALLQMLIGALPDPRYEGAPFALGHPDFGAQNIFVDDAGTVVGIVDWDGVYVGPRQITALTYPNWITVDWEPMAYENLKNQDGAEPEEDLRRYRRVYANAVGGASGGAFTSITRNSHVVATLYSAITNMICSTSILFQLGTYVFGSSVTTLDVVEAIEHSGWYTGSPEQEAEITLWERPNEFLNSGDGDSDRSGTSEGSGEPVDGDLSVDRDSVDDGSKGADPVVQV